MNMFLNILTWFLILMGVCGVGILVWFILWTITEGVDP